MKKIFRFSNSTADWVLMATIDVVRGFKGLKVTLNKKALIDEGTITIDADNLEKLAQAEQYLSQGNLKNIFILVEKAIPLPD